MSDEIDRLYDAVIELVQAGDFIGATTVFAQAIERAKIERSPLLGELWDHHGKALASMGKHERAVTSFDAARAVQPDVPEFTVHLADSLLELGENVRAEKLYLDAMRNVLPGEELGEHIQKGLAKLQDA